MGFPPNALLVPIQPLDKQVHEQVHRQVYRQAHRQVHQWAHRQVHQWAHPQDKHTTKSAKCKLMSRQNANC